MEAASSYAYMADAPREKQEEAGRIRMHPSGRLVNPCALRAEDIDIGDIAHHLSLICRYTGGCPFHYSVAQHSVLVSQYFSVGMPQMRLAALLHDASEAFLNDLASPIKHQPGFTFYREAEEAAMRVIYARFNLPFELLASIKPFDDLMFRREVESFRGRITGPERVRMIPPGRAKDDFLHEFEDAMRRLGA